MNDTNILKAFTDLATHVNNTYITITFDLVTDMNRNRIVPISVNNALRVQTLTGDRISPQLLSFELDLDSGELMLTFSETINASSLQVDQLRLQSTQDGNSTYWQLTPIEVNVSPSANETTGVLLGSAIGSGLMSTSGSGSGSALVSSGLEPISQNSSFQNDSSRNVTTGAPIHSFTTSPDHPIIIIQLGFIDLNEIKRLTDLATVVDNTYLSLTPNAFADMNGNPIIEVPSHNATQASAVYPDDTSPQLVSFNLNLTSELLLLTFDETVNASSLQPQTIVVQEAEYTHLVSLISWYQLQGGVGPTMDDYIITVQLEYQRFE